MNMELKIHVPRPDSYRDDSWWHHLQSLNPAENSVGFLYFYMSYKLMNYSCYILFSKLVNRFYIGYTSDINERLKLHNNGFFGTKSYSYKSTDWELYLLIPCTTIGQAVFIEAKIKKMKSRKYIENLKRYPELVHKILNEYGTENPCAPSR